MKFLLIAVDGLDVERIMAWPKLENFRLLLEYGCYGRLPTHMPPMAPAGLCLAAGQDPGYLGLYTEASHTLPADPLLWELITAQGGTAVLLGLPPAWRRPNFTGHWQTQAAADPFTACRQQFATARHWLETVTWDYFHLYDDGLSRLSRQLGPEDATVMAYYQALDAEIGSLLPLLDEETAVLLLSTHSIIPLHGGFCLNDWLRQQGYLALNTEPIIPADPDINWANTLAWATGGDAGYLYLNLQGRDPQGCLAPEAAPAVLAELAARLEAVTDDDGRSLGTITLRPADLFAVCNGRAPDLIVHSGGLNRQTLAQVGHSHLLVDTLPHKGIRTPTGSFILTMPGSPLSGELSGVTLLDMAPTILDLSGYPLPAAWPGQSLVSKMTAGTLTGADLSTDEETLLRERLSGLGYIG